MSLQAYSHSQLEGLRSCSDNALHNLACTLSDGVVNLSLLDYRSLRGIRFVYLVWRARLSFVSAQRCPVIINLGWTACDQQQVCSMNWAAELQSAQCVCELCCQTCVIMTVICINRKCGLCLPGNPHESAQSP